MRVGVGRSVVLAGAPFPDPPSGSSTATLTRARSGPSLPTPAVTMSGVYPLITITSAHTAHPDILTVEVAASGDLTVTTIEVADEVVSLAEIRRDPGMRDVGRVPDRLLLGIRDGLLRLCEDFVGACIGRQFAAVTVDTAGGLALMPPHARPVVEIVSATCDGDAVAVADLDVWGDGFAVKVPRSGRWAFELEVGATPSPRLSSALVKAIRRDVMGRAASLPSDALWESQDGTTVRFSTADWAAGRPTGVLDLDAALSAMRESAGVG